MYHRGISNDAHVATPTGDSRFAQRHDVILDGNFLFDTPIKVLVLEENHRIVVANRSFDKTLRVVRACGTNHFQPRRVHKPRLRILGVKWTSVDVPSARPSNHQRCRRAPTVVGLGHHVYDLVESATDEVHELKLSHGTHTGERGAKGGADNRRFRNRSVNHALGSEAIDEAVSHFESSAINANVLADAKDAGIALHLLPDSLAYGFEIGKLRHRLFSWRSEEDGCLFQMHRCLSQSGDAGLRDTTLGCSVLRLDLVATRIAVHSSYRRFRFGHGRGYSKVAISFKLLLHIGDQFFIFLRGDPFLSQQV